MFKHDSRVDLYRQSFVNKKILKYIVSPILLVVLFGFGLHFNVIKLPITRSMHSLYVADFSNDQELINWSDNIFVGRVLERVGYKNDVIPTTQFTVEVIENIKGDIQGKVTITKSGGYKNGIYYVVDGDVIHQGVENINNVFQSNSTYLFVVRGPDASGWYHVTSFPGVNRLISANAFLDKAQLKELSAQDERVKQLKGMLHSDSAQTR